MSSPSVITSVASASLPLPPPSYYYHGSIKTSLAEGRLRSHGEDSFLFRESSTKKGIFILSTFKGQFNHLQIPNSEGKNNFQTYKEASSVVVEMINSSTLCQNPVPCPFPISSEVLVSVQVYPDNKDTEIEEISIRKTIAEAELEIDNLQMEIEQTEEQTDTDTETEDQVEKVGTLLINSDRPLKERFRALFTLKNIGGKQCIDWIAKAFDDESALLKHKLAYCLGQLQDPLAIPILTQVLSDPARELMVRHEAAEA